MQEHGYSYELLNAAQNRFTLAHEVGHNLGVMHDPANATTSAAYSYGYGYISPGGYGDIMSYASNRINYYSNPNLIINGQPFGSPTQNTVEALNNIRFLAASWRPTRV